MCEVVGDEDYCNGDKNDEGEVDIGKLVVVCNGN